jgi:uncharacterized protein with HEPN domain
MPKRSDALLIADIVDNAEAIFEFVGSDTYESVIANREKTYAIVRAFEIIGEAAKLVSDDTKTRYPIIEWRLMSDFRNVLIHHYFGIDYEALWTVVQEALPMNYELLKAIRL